MAQSISRCGKELLVLKESLEKLLGEESIDVPKLSDLVIAMEAIPISIDLLRMTKVGATLQKAKNSVGPKSPACNIIKRLLTKWRKCCSSDEDENKEGPVSLVDTSVSKRKPKPISRYEDEVLRKEADRTVKKIGTITIYPESQLIPSKDKHGYLVFSDYPDFRPNLTPKEVMQMGSFGGTYFRVITSGVTGETYRDAWKEFPPDWFTGLNISRQVTRQDYDTAVNLYKTQCGGDLHMWESSGWITAADPFGWFQWYCRFYLGRRCSDDQRQISRAQGVMGPKGRWRNNLVNKCIAKMSTTSSGTSKDKCMEMVLADKNVSPKVRQLLQV